MYLGKKTNPKVSIIILNWNSWKDTIECLESLYQITYPNYDVIVVDNGSEDESIEELREYCKGNIEVKSKFFTYLNKNKPINLREYTKKQIEINSPSIIKKEGDISPNKKMILIKNDKNFGFAEGNNIAIIYALNNLNTDYILLLNNDTVVDKRFLEELIKVAESETNIGIVGPKTYFYHQPNKLQLIWNRIDYIRGKIILFGAGEIDQGQFDKIKETDYTPGSCILIKQEVLKKIGLLDFRYYLYWEETEYCTRSKRNGYRDIYCPKAKIWHKVSQSTNKISGLTTYYSTRNRFWFMKKYATNTQYLLFILYFFTYEFWFLIIIYIIHQRNKTTFISFIKGVIDGIK